MKLHTLRPRKIRALRWAAVAAALYLFGVYTGLLTPLPSLLLYREAQMEGLGKLELVEQRDSAVQSDNHDRILFGDNEDYTLVSTAKFSPPFGWEQIWDTLIFDKEDPDTWHGSLARTGIDSQGRAVSALYLVGFVPNGEAAPTLRVGPVKDVRAYEPKPDATPIEGTSYYLLEDALTEVTPTADISVKGGHCYISVMFWEQDYLDQFGDRVCLYSVPLGAQTGKATAPK